MTRNMNTPKIRCGICGNSYIETDMRYHRTICGPGSDLNLSNVPIRRMKHKRAREDVLIDQIVARGDLPEMIPPPVCGWCGGPCQMEIVHGRRRRTADQHARKAA